MSIFSSPDYGGAARKSNQYTQRQIDEGMQLINAIFGGGGTVPTFNRASGTYDPSQNYLTYAGQTGAYSRYHPPTGPQAGNAKRGAAAGAAYGSRFLPGAGTALGAIGGAIGGLFHRKNNPLTPAQMLHQGKLYTMGTGTTYKGYGPQFLSDYGEAYIQNANPQLAQQYKENFDANAYSMANRGLTTSSANTQAIDKLQQTAGQGQAAIANQAQSLENSMQQSINQQKQQAIDTLYQTANPSAAATSAIATSSNAQVPSSFQPIGNIFSNFANQYYLNQLMSSYQPGAGGGVAAPFSMGTSTAYQPSNQ